MARRAVFLLIIALLLAPGPPATAGAVAIGPGGEPELSTWHPLLVTPLGAGWLAGPRTVAADPDSGHWLKSLQSPGFLLRHTDTFYLLEVLRVGPGPEWVGWHEEILTPGWDWGSGVMFAYSPGDPGADGFSWSAARNASPLARGEISGDAMDFFFEALDPGSWVFTLKTLEWAGGEGAKLFAPIRIAEHPSAVPVPAAAVLLGSGLMALAALRTRRPKVQDPA